MIRTFLVTAAWLPVLTALPASLPAPESEITVHDAWIAEAPPTTGVNAGYLIIDNKSDRDRILESAASPAFNRVEMHRTVTTDDGVSSMRRQHRISVPAGGRIEFRPGGYHLMLFDPHKTIQSGMRIPLSLHFADDTALDTTADVRRIDSHQEHH